MPYRPGEQADTARRLKANKTYNATRPARHKLYNTVRWRKVRAWYYRNHPLCRECGKHGVTALGEIVDHIVPIEDGGAPYEEDNLQTLCMACHNKKHYKGKLPQ